MAVLLAIIFLLEGLVETYPSVFCETSEDCLNLSHEDCPGGWECIDNYCSWECEGAAGCVSSSDCEGLPHTECVGEWHCEDRECVWACEVGQVEPGIEYRIGGCEEELARGGASRGSLEFSPAADGIRMTQSLDYVCCANIELAVERDGNRIKVYEKNIGEMCRCMCTYDIEAEVETLPGTYRIEVYGVEYEDMPGEKLGEGTVTVGKTEGSVLFVEQHTTVDGTIVAGDYPYEFADGPAYRFDEDSRTLKGKMDFDPSDVAVIYGTGKTLTGDAGRGTKSSLRAVRSVPKEVNGDEVTRIWEDGAVAIRHNDETVTVSPGGEWVQTTTEEVTSPYQTGVMRMTTTDTITNHGYIPIEDIEAL